MKTVKDTLLQRRSIRRYEREDINSEYIDLIRDAIRNTPPAITGSNTLSSTSMTK